MRERRPGDWRIDLAQRHPLEAEVARALDHHPDLVRLQSSTASLDRLDYQLLGPGERLCELELKTKRQPYRGWAHLRPELAEADVFILDELALRRIVDAGRYAFLLVRDIPANRWALWSTAELVLASKVRVSRRLAATSVTDKGKLLIDLAGAAAVAHTLPAALGALAELVTVIDRQWCDVGPWPWREDARRTKGAAS
ncbi:MAG: hypothetical protein KY439_09925 [Actinobacteria bacterium]|nr:hypothetical protein [Actinomycetota bacterium]